MKKIQINIFQILLLLFILFCTVGFIGYQILQPTTTPTLISYPSKQDSYSYSKKENNHQHVHFKQREKPKLEKPRHVCIHDEKIVPHIKKQQKEFEEFYQLEENKEEWEKIQKQNKRREAHGYQYDDFRFHVDFTNIRELEQDHQDFVEFQLIPAVKAYFQYTFKVDRRTEAIQMPEYFRNNPCIDSIIPDEHIDDGVEDIDYLMYVAAFNDPDKPTLAYAGSCLTGAYKRPIVGSFSVNLAYLENDIDTARWFVWIDTVQHEMMHALGFSQNHFPNYNNGQGPIFTKQNGRIWITAPEVVKYGQMHFGCNKVNGLPIENEGGPGSAGSHWERVTFGNEGMTASSFGNGIFSKFTLLLFKSSKWYDPIMKNAQSFGWGYKSGCYSMSGQCDDNNIEICTQDGATMCDAENQSYGQCSKQGTFNDGCGIVQAYGNRNCKDDSNDDFATELEYINGYLGPDSFNINFSRWTGTTGCFRSGCLKREAYIQYDGQWQLCQYANQQLRVSMGTIECPEDLVSFCRDRASCPSACTGQGKCVFSKTKQSYCKCYDGFSGYDCSQADQ